MIEIRLIFCVICIAGIGLPVDSRADEGPHCDSDSGPSLSGWAIQSCELVDSTQAGPLSYSALGDDKLIVITVTSKPDDADVREVVITDAAGNSVMSPNLGLGGLHSLGLSDVPKTIPPQSSPRTHATDNFKDGSRTWTFVAAISGDQSELHIILPGVDQTVVLR